MPSPTSLAPGYVRCTYDGHLFPHHMTIPVNYDGTPTPGVEPDILLKDASSSGVEAALATYVDLFKVFFHTSIHFGNAEAHAVDDTTGEDTFLWTWNIGKVGTSTNAQVAMGENVWTFKTSVGSLYRLYLMEDSSPVNVKNLPPYTDSSPLALSDYIVGPSSMVYGRKNAYPLAPVSQITKTNDTLRKQQGKA